MKRLFARFALTIALLMPLGNIAAVNAQSAGGLFDPICNNSSGGPSTSGSTVCQDRNDTQSTSNNSFYGRNGILTKAARIVAFVVGVASVIMIIIGGFKYVLSNGDSNAINSAKNTIIYAVIGLVIAIIASAIIGFIVNRL